MRTVKYIDKKRRVSAVNRLKKALIAVLFLLFMANYTLGATVLDSAISVVPSFALIGDSITIYMTITNSGTDNATNVQPLLAQPVISGTGNAIYISGPLPANAPIAVASSQVFTWLFQATAAGNISFTDSAWGIDTGTSLPVSGSAATSNSITILAPTVTPTGSVPTSTFTPSAPTYTPTNTQTATATSTGSIMPTNTPTDTETPGITPSLTPSNTFTPSSPTFTPTNTQTTTATYTATVPPSATPTFTWTATAVGFTMTPTATPTVTISATPNPSPLFILKNIANPVRGEKIKFNINVNEANDVIVKIYDRRAQLVDTLVSERMDAGIYNIEWDGLVSTNTFAGTGFYIIYVRVGNTETKQKIMIIK